MHVYSDDVEVVIAADAVDAKKVIEDHVNAGQQIWYTHPPEIEFEQWPDDKVFTVCEYGPRAVDTTMTCAEWVKAHGRGFLASLDY